MKESAMLMAEGRTDWEKERENKTKHERKVETTREEEEERPALPVRQEYKREREGVSCHTDTIFQQSEKSDNRNSL